MTEYKRYSNANPKDTQVYILDVYHSAGQRVSSNFRLGEFSSGDDANTVLVHPLLLALLERIRRKFQRPVEITSGYRTEAHNEDIGGAEHSRHTFGMAADIRVLAEKRQDDAVHLGGGKWIVDPSIVAEFAEQIRAGGVGRYKSFTHVDVQGANRRWEG